MKRQQTQRYSEGKQRYSWIKGMVTGNSKKLNTNVVNVQEDYTNR